MGDVQLQFNSNDPSITYYQGWNAGSFITVFGILPALANSSTNASFILDNGPPTYFSANLTDQIFQNQPLFQPNATLQEGSTYPPSLELDYYTITPPVSSLLIQVEDTDSSILYAGPWNTTPTVATQPNFDSTLHSTNSPNASLIYSFTGTFIAIYGLYHPGPAPNVSFTVDSSPPAPLLNPPDPIISDISQSLFYQSPVLSAQSHTLTVNVGENNQGEFTVDYLLVQTTPTSSTATSSTATSSTLASKSSSVNVGAIAGGVLGVVAIIILLVLAIIYILRRNRYRTPTSENKTSSAFAQRIRRIEKRLSVSVLSLRSQRRTSNSLSPQEDRRTYYVDGSGRPLRVFTGRGRSSTMGTTIGTTPTTLRMPTINFSSSPNASTSHISLPRYPPPARQGRTPPAAEPDVEAGNNSDINVINPSTSAATLAVMYGHDEKFAMFGQL
ncbi:hypothetical protein F5887DRAFT_950609 [Amanita rubescens]|nr:hypothetical protein F5887DRAFT_950609 [Amanita rubescens]